MNRIIRSRSIELFHLALDLNGSTSPLPDRSSLRGPKRSTSSPYVMVDFASSIQPVGKFGSRSDT